MKAGRRDHFEIGVRRSCTAVKFGISFSAERGNPNEGRASVDIRVGEDMEHMALRKGDRVVTMNGFRVRRVRDLQCMMNRALTLRIVLQRVGLSRFNLSP